MVHAVHQPRRNVGLVGVTDRDSRQWRVGSGKLKVGQKIELIARHTPGQEVPITQSRRGFSTESCRRFDARSGTFVKVGGWFGPSRLKTMGSLRSTKVTRALNCERQDVEHETERPHR